MTIEKKEEEYEFGDPITPYFIKPDDRVLNNYSASIHPASTITYFNEDEFVLEIWSIEKVDLNPEKGLCEFKGAPIVSIPYADLWRGLSWSKWKPENENELPEG